MGYKVNPPSSEVLREMAASRLAKSGTEDGASLTVEQARKLLEEAAASRLEVEIQNVHLQETCARLQVAINEFTDHYDWAPVACLSTDGGGRITRLNLVCANLLGQERKALIGRSFVDFLSPPQQDRVKRLMQCASGGGEEQQVDVSLDSGKGEVQHLQLALTPLGASHGHHMVLINITERKALEKDLHVSEERWKLALEATGEGVWDWDLRTDTLRYSPRLERLYGGASAAMDRSMAGWRERVHPQDWPALLGQIQKCLSGQEHCLSNEHRGRCADGSWKWILCQGSVHGRDAAGRVTRMVGTHTDISARKHMEEELRDLRGVQRAMLDAFPQYLAVLDAQGRVLRTNDMWNALGLAKGFSYRSGYLNTDYALLLDSMTGGDGETKRAALTGIRDVVAARAPGFRMEYSFHAHGQTRHFIMHVIAVREGQARAVVSHQDVSSMMRAARTENTC